MMRAMNILISILLLCPVYVLANSPEDSSEDDFFFEVGAGLMTNEWMVVPQNTQLDSSLIPMVQVGVGWQTALTPALELTTSVSVSHSQSNDFRFAPTLATAMHTAEIENTGVWVDTRIAYTELFDSVKPFISVGAGRVYGQYTDEMTEISGWETGYRAFAGLEFEISPDFSFSLALGTADMGELE